MNNDIHNISKCKKIAIMGGTFDPIHFGHLVAAESVRKHFNIDKVLFIPTGSPPHKDNQNITDQEHRYTMTILATADNPHFLVSRMEMERSGTSYTIDTVREIQKIFKGDIYFITGADTVYEMLTWKQPDDLLRLCKFVAVTRPGYKKEKLTSKIEELKLQYKSKFYFVEIPALAISSSDIRNRVNNNESIRYLLPISVEEYIKKASLYKKEERVYEKEEIAVQTPDSFQTVNQYVKSVLSKDRYAHTLGVISEAEKLSVYFGANVDKARMAAVLHDCCKEIPSDEKKKLCREYKIKLDDVMKKQIDLSHSFLAAEVAKRKFNINDQEVLDAIKYHTTGRADMSLLEKIIYVADCIEPSRGDYEGLELIRKVAYEDLDKAVYLGIKATVNYNKRKKRLIHPLSIQAIKIMR